MPELSVALLFSQERIRAFTYNELELRVSASISEQEPYWAECIFEVPPPLSLAPDKSLLTAKSYLGILHSGEKREKRVKIYSGSDVYPNTYPVKVTFYIYDKEGAISERKEYTKEIECGEANAQILQSP